MNTPNPLVPQGTTPFGGKNSLLRTVLTIVAVHVAIFGSFLMWGCSKETPKSPDATSASSIGTNDTLPVADSNTAPLGDISRQSNAPTTSTGASTGSPVAGSPGSGPAAGTPPVGGAYSAPLSPISSSTPLAPAISGLTPTTSSTSGAAVASETPASEYVIAKGDTLATVATKKGVSLKALQAANPGVDPRKLKVGQKIQIPAATGSTATVAGTSTEGSAAAPSEGVEKTYTVKAGDTLARIATKHHTTVKAIAALNGLKSQNSLKVGQKLKLPAGKSSGAASSATPSAATTPVPAPVSTPAASSAYSPAQIAPLSPVASPAGVAR